MCTGAARLPGIMALGYIASFSEVLASTVIKAQVRYGCAFVWACALSDRVDE